MRNTLLLVAILCCISAAVGSRCLQLPRTLAQGEKCGRSSVGCAYGLVCKTNGLCSEPYKVGESCKLTYECVRGSTCRAGICLDDLNPGSSCNTTVPELPVCGSGLNCGFLTNTCNGGQLGDSCVSNDDCRTGLNCTSLVCTGAKSGESCSGSGSGSASLCDIGLYCDRTGLNFVCRPRLTSGKCSSTDECQLGYTCIGTTPSDDRQCVAFETRLAGEYCGSESRLCKDSLRCYGSYCAEKSPRFCRSAGECGYKEICTCSGASLSNGIGSCTENKCIDEVQARDKCLDSKCGEIRITERTYSGSCAYKNCLAEIDAYLKCNSAFRTAVSYLLLVTLFVFFV